MKKRITLAINPEQGLERQFLFWLAIILPISLALILGIIALKDYSLAFNTNAYNTFLDISKLPIGLSSLAIPLAILVGKLHGSRQTAMQIDNTKRQILNAEQDNKTKLYLSHFDHFSKHIDLVELNLKKRYDEILNKENISILNKLGIYRFIYPDNSLSSGIKPASEHFKLFSQNTMTMTYTAYKNLVYTKNDILSFQDNLINLEHCLLNAQNRCFKCLASRESIFKKKTVKNIDIAKQFPYGVSINLTDYYEQFDFLCELLNGIESFELLNEDDRIATRFFREFRDVNSKSIEDNRLLNDLWNTFNMTYCTEYQMPE